MKTFSIWSIAFMALGLLSLGVNWIMEGYFEPIILIGSVFLLLGAVCSFIAIAKGEKTSIKYIPLVSFFIILLVVTWSDPFQVIRMLTWFKNIT
ncbi:hypothetical protein [Peribacillus deserti]|uniref:Uncharacterized protein n=1 Tax=Peribacillus deserti TaxID=673318 RepID=A0A2N5M0N9_9BACI|nr:hypothetical protein [Peribacillus deserti]PLT27921.1 hypothetical protein CUU66_21565 [Peribacillus deserti]